MGTYSDDRAFTDRFDDELKRLIGALVVTTASIRQDTKQATDFVVHQVENLCYACRVRRRARNFGRYSDEFTIRSWRDSGAPAEFAKILQGWGDRLFYGWGNDDEQAGTPGSIFPWVVIDLAVFRANHQRLTDAVVRRDGGSGQKPNRDVCGRPDGTWFRYFHLRDAAQFTDLIVKSSTPITPWQEVVIHELCCWHCGRRWNAPDAPITD